MLIIKCLIKKSTTCNKLEIVVGDESNKKGQKSLTAVPNNSNDQPEGKLLHKKPQRTIKGLHCTFFIVTDISDFTILPVVQIRISN